MKGGGEKRFRAYRPDFDPSPGHKSGQWRLYRPAHGSHGPQIQDGGKDRADHPPFVAHRTWSRIEEDVAD